MDGLNIVMEYLPSSLFVAGEGTKLEFLSSPKSAKALPDGSRVHTYEMIRGRRKNGDMRYRHASIMRVEG